MTNRIKMEGNMPVKKIKEFFDNHGVEHVLISHSQAFTVQQGLGHRWPKE